MDLTICTLRGLIIKKIYLTMEGNSEFYGLKYSEQLSKIEAGLSEFMQKKYKGKKFFRPLIIIYMTRTL